MDGGGAAQALSWVVGFFVFYVGASVGSFLNVVAYRVPAGLSIVSPRSHCPHCKTTIRWYDNLPVLSWFLLRGRCRFCGVPISGRYPLIEALTGTAALGIAWRFAPSAAEMAMGFSGGIGTAVIYFVFSSALIAAALVDWDIQIVPDEISLPGIPLGVLASATVTPVTFLDSVIGALAGGAVLLAVAKGYFVLTRREGMGMGDVKLLAMIGAFLGWQALPFVLLGGSLVGIVVGFALIRARGKGLRHAFAFGPFLCGAAIAYLFVGDAVGRWYLGATGLSGPGIW